MVGSTGAVVPVTHTDTLEYIIHGSAGHLHFDVMDGALRLYTEDGVTDEPILPVADRYPMAGPARNLVDLALGVGAERLARRVRAADRRDPATPPIGAPARTAPPSTSKERRS